MLASSVVRTALDMVLEHLFALQSAPVDEQPASAPLRRTASGSRRPQSLGTTLSLDGTCYHVPGAPIACGVTLAPHPAWLDGDLFAITVLNVAAVADVAETIAGFARDDVWTRAFLDTTIVTVTHQGRKAFEVEGVSVIVSADGETTSSIAFSQPLTAGPYFGKWSAGGLQLFAAYRLYPDLQRAFQSGVVQQADGSFINLSSRDPSYPTVDAIAVPSRLYFPAPTPDRPLSGLRVSVKDLFDLEDVRTTQGSRAWEQLYPPASRNAAAVQRLIDLGAVIVGKTRLSQFAHGSRTGLGDDVDFGRPLNPRGDGNQDPSASSSGAGVSIAAYHWLDMALGSDTGGSVRAPAGANGVFGNRPSLGMISLEGALPVSHELDTAAFLVRSARLFGLVGRVLYPGLAASPRLSHITKLVYPLSPTSTDQLAAGPGLWPATHDLAVPIYERFVAGLEQLLQLERSPYDLWERCKTVLGGSPCEVVGSVYGELTAHDSWHHVKHLYSDHAARHDGDEPLVNPFAAANFALGRAVTPERRAELVARKERFARFLARDYLRSSTEIAVFPLNQGMPSSNSTYLSAPELGRGGSINRYALAQLGGLPEVVLPIGQVSFYSTATKSIKFLPVTVSLQAAAGADLVLYDLIDRLVDAGLVSPHVLTGPTAFDLATF